MSPTETARARAAFVWNSSGETEIGISADADSRGNSPSPLAGLLEIFHRLFANRRFALRILASSIAAFPEFRSGLGQRVADLRANLSSFLHGYHSLKTTCVCLLSTKVSLTLSLTLNRIEPRRVIGSTLWDGFLGTGVLTREPKARSLPLALWR
jgi:hypothetical protein